MKHKYKELNRRDAYMIGDWVYVDGKPYRWKAEDYDRSRLGMQNVTYIPISDEILKANGFEETNIGFMTKIFERPSYVMKLNESGYYGVEVIGGYCNIKARNEERIELPFEANIQCNYVHELQHALRLVGLVDMAENFEVNDVNMDV